MAQVVEHLPGKHKALNSNNNTAKNQNGSAVLHSLPVDVGISVLQKLRMRCIFKKDLK
jgi:hypothetical protein